MCWVSSHASHLVTVINSSVQALFSKSWTIWVTASSCTFLPPKLFFFGFVATQLARQWHQEPSTDGTDSLGVCLCFFDLRVRETWGILEERRPPGILDLVHEPRERKNPDSGLTTWTPGFERSGIVNWRPRLPDLKLQSWSGGAKRWTDTTRNTDDDVVAFITS